MEIETKKAVAYVHMGSLQVHINSYIDQNMDLFNQFEEFTDKLNDLYVKGPNSKKSDRATQLDTIIHQDFKNMRNSLKGILDSIGGIAKLID